MGLISWIKSKYHDNRLKKAVNLEYKGDLQKAEEVFRSLLGKQEQAVVHLANMFASHSKSVEEKLSALNSIIELRDFTNENNKSDFEKALFSHVKNIDDLAISLFKKEDYENAVLLMNKVLPYKGQINNFSEKYHQYHAFLAFTKSQGVSYAEGLFKDTIDELNKYSQSIVADVNNFVSRLKSQKRFSRIIQLLIPILEKDKNFKKIAIDAIVNVIQGNDSETKDPKSLTAFCKDNKLCKDAADELVKLSNSSASKNDFKSSVLFDSFASEYYSSDSQFNYNRCIHILEEQRKRESAKEMKSLLKLASDLQLTEQQIASLKKRIAQITKSASPVNAIEICRLFNGETDFDLIYIAQAEKLVADDKTAKIDETELMNIIKRNTDDDSFVDVVIPFVNINSFEKAFLSAAIAKIQRHKSMPMLEKYWQVKRDIIFFEKLISKSSNITKDVVSFVTNKHQLFLKTKEHRKSFCKSLDALKDNSYALSSAEVLVQKKCDINDYFVTVAIKESDGKKTPEGISIIDHALTVLVDEKLLTKKKELIRQLIKENDFELAEKEAKSLSSFDDEADTILAELYFVKGGTTSDLKSKKNAYFQVLDVCERGKVLDSFYNSKNETLKELTVVSKTFLNNDQPGEAYGILDRLDKYQQFWLPLFIELRNTELSKIESLGQRIKFEEESINKIVSTVENPKSVDDSAYYALWRSYIDLLLKKSKSQPKHKAIDSLNSARAQLNNSCNESARLADNLTLELVKLEWSHATELEADLDFTSAIPLYQSIAEDSIQSYKGRAELRALICHVKAGTVNKDVEKRINSALNLKSHEALKDDLAYRFAYYLLKSTRPADAESILKKYLPNESQLLGLCENIYIKEAENHLLDFNRKIKSVIEGSMTVEQATSFLKEIDNYKALISPKLPDTTSKFNSYKSKLESYILKAMFIEEKYEDAFEKMLLMYPEFIENDNQFRNIAIAALGLVESGTAKENNIKYAISIWLSAVYTDRLFVKSLDYTSWDDDFTFTLEGSLGKSSEYDFNLLPDNVNFDEPVENLNVAIKDVQESLLSRMETFIRDNYPKYEKFFNAEKEALNDLIKLELDEDCVIATPYLYARLPMVDMPIKDALDNDIAQGYDNREAALDVGVRYGFTGSDYTAYRDAQLMVDACKTSLSKDVSTISSAFSAVPQIKVFSRLYSSLKSFVSSRMNDDIKAEKDYKQFINVYEVICKALNEPSISLAFSNHANGEVIRRLNKEQMKLSDGVNYMVRIYNVAPSSIQVKKNLEGMLAHLAIEAEENNNNADRCVVDRAVTNTGGVFKKIVNDARVQVSLSAIIESVNSGKKKKNKALHELYDLYKRHSDNDRVCENLVTLCDMCIMEYVIKDSWNSSSVTTVLDALIENKSSTFRKYNAKLAQTYQQIWNSLPFETRSLISGMGGYGQTLNSKGIALKCGLSYYRKLGDVPTKTSKFGGLFGGGLFDDIF